MEKKRSKIRCAKDLNGYTREVTIHDSQHPPPGQSLPHKDSGGHPPPGKAAGVAGDMIPSWMGITDASSSSMFL